MCDAAVLSEVVDRASDVSQVLDCYAYVARLSVSSCRCELGNGFEPLKIRARRG